MNYMTSLQTSEKWKISQRRVAVLCPQNRISGAIKAGKTWLIQFDCEKPKDERLECQTPYHQVIKDICVSESPVYSVKTELMLNSYLVEASKTFFAKSGKTLSEGINEYLQKVVSEQAMDCRSSYPQGFFNLFGSCPNLDIPIIDDLVPEQVEL